MKKLIANIRSCQLLCNSLWEKNADFNIFLVVMYKFVAKLGEASGLTLSITIIFTNFVP